MSGYKRRGDDWWIVWLIYLMSPFILFFGLIILASGFSILGGYIEFIQDITGFEDRSFLLLVAFFTPPLIIIYLLNRLFKANKAQKDRAPHNE